jgi:hypothetical protein
MSATRLPLVFALSLPLAGAFAPAALAQLTVGPAGSGAQFTEVSAALALAVPGNTILVAPGNYAPFTVDKGVSVVGAGADVCSVTVPAGSTQGAIEVTAVPPGATARVVGFGTRWSTPSAAPRVSVHNCGGRVELVDVESLGVQWQVQPYIDAPVLSVVSSAAVVLDDCRLFGHGAGFDVPWKAGTVALEAVGSRVWLSGSELRGGWGNEGYGGAALFARSGSSVHVSGSVLLGGSGGSHFGFYEWDIYSFDGEEAVSVLQSEVVLAGGPGNRIEGGLGFDIQPYGGSGGGPAVRLISDAVVRYAPDAVLLGGVGLFGLLAPTTIGELLPTNTLIAEPLARPTLGLDPALAQPGDLVTVTASGQAGALHLAFTATQGIAPLTLPGPFALHLDPAAVVLLAALPLDGAGLGSVAIALPNNPALVGVGLVLQSLDADLSFLRLSNPALFAVVP